MKTKYFNHFISDFFRPKRLIFNNAETSGGEEVENKTKKPKKVDSMDEFGDDKKVDSMDEFGDDEVGETELAGKESINKFLNDVSAFLENFGESDEKPEDKGAKKRKVDSMDYFDEQDEEEARRAGTLKDRPPKKVDSMDEFE